MKKPNKSPYAPLALAAVIVLAIGFASYAILARPAAVTTTNSTSSTSILPNPDTIRAGVSFNVIASEDASTGYSWNISIDDPSIVAYAGNLGCIVSPTMPGEGCNTTFSFKALSTGTTEIRMRYLRPWEANSTIQTKNISVKVTP